MKPLRAVIVALALAALSPLAPALAADTAPATQPATAPAATTQSATPKDLTATIDECITLLEAGKNKELLERLIEPKALAAIKEGGRFEKLTESFGKSNKAKNLLAALKTTGNISPTLSDDGARAKFDLPGKNPSDGPGGIAFIKHDGKWYLEGH